MTAGGDTSGPGAGSAAREGPRAARARAAWPALLGCAVAFLLLGPALVAPGGLLARHAAAFPPLANEDPGRAGLARLEVRVDGAPEGGAWRVVAEQWYPGWRASVDGTPAEVLRADHALRAVRIPAGDCTVEMRYAPASRQVGRAGLGLGALLLLLTRRRRGAEARP